MRATMRRDLAIAMKARDAVAVAALRSALAAIENAEAVDLASVKPSEQAPAVAAHSEYVGGAVVGVGSAEVPRRTLTDDDLTGIVLAERDSRLSAADDFLRHGAPDRAERLRAEADVLTKYLAG